MQALLACVLDLTHAGWGFAPISRKRLQDWTGRSRWALDRATAKAKKQGLLNTIERRNSYDLSDSTIFIPNWPPFYEAFDRVENLRAKTHSVENETEHAGAKTHMGACENAQAMCENAEPISLYYPSIDNLSSSPSGEPLSDFKKEKEKEGIQEEP